MAYHVRKYRKPHSYRQGKSTEVKIVEALGRGIWFIVSLPFKLLFGGGRNKSGRNYQETSLDRSFVQTKWQEIDELMRLGSPSNFSRAVLEGDKLLDHVLKGLRTPGLTMGDRLKAARNKFTPEAYDAAWRAHKVRNEIVHESEYQITDFIAREAIANFKKAIGELI